jgi:hypothetical protein
MVSTPMKKFYTLLALLVLGVLAALTQLLPGRRVDNPAQAPQAQAANHICGMQMNDDDVVFCDTFDNPINSRPVRHTGLDPDVWGVSRATGNINFGQGGFNSWYPTQIEACNGTRTVTPPNDVIVCNGRVQQAVNDGHGVTVLAIYPKQPFDWAGRTGTVSFDVSNDTQGGHAAWPEFWVTDTPIPTPFNHFNSWISFPRHGFGIRFEINGEIGEYGMCPNGNNLNKRRWSMDSAVVVRNYNYEDTQGWGDRSNGMQVHITDCVISPDGPNAGLNHVEVRVSQNQIDVYASDAGSTALRRIGYVTNANLTLSRGLIWLEDGHYNASKGACPPQTNKNPICQTEHTFSWDNVAFDGPFTYRDFSYDALDNNTSGPDGTINLGKVSSPGQAATWNVLNMPANPQAAAVRVLFNLSVDRPTTINVGVNGHPYTIPWPYPTNVDQYGNSSWRTYPLSISLSDLVPGTNVVTIGSPTDGLMTANVNIVLVDVPGGVPVLPGADNRYPGSTGNPPPPPSQLPPPPPPPVLPPPPPPSGFTCPTSIPTNAFLGCYWDNVNFTGSGLSRTDNSINFNWGSGSPDASIGSDSYSARWEGNFSFNSAQYTFTATTDDGVRVYVDGVPVIDQWSDHGATTFTGTSNLASGTHRVRVEYYESAGSASAVVSWAQNGGTNPPPPPPGTVAKSITLDLEGRVSNKAVTGNLQVLNSSKAVIRSYPFTTNSSGSASLNLDNTSGSLFFKVKAAPFLTRLISGDINTGLAFAQLKSGDISQDNIVNSIDFSTMNINWFTSNPAPDLNADGIVNSLDFSLMNRNWFARGEE